MYNAATRCRWAMVLVPTLGRAESRRELENRALWLLCLGGTTSTLEVDKVNKCTSISSVSSYRDLFETLSLHFL